MKTIQKEITEQLISAASGYARAGLSLMLGQPKLGINSQAAIGNLSIATELLMKSFIAKQHLVLLFKDIPSEQLFVLLAYKSLPDTYPTARCRMELKSSNLNYIDFEKSVKIVCDFLPDLKKQHGAHLKHLRTLRNNCVHSIHPEFYEYEVQRTAYIFLSLLQYIKSFDEELVNQSDWGNEERNKKCLNSFDADRVKRVHEKIEKAKITATDVSEKKVLESYDWDWCPAACPVCRSDGRLHGETEPVGEYDELFGEISITLNFAPYYFQCDICGLELEDYDEMEIGGLDVSIIDRTEDFDFGEEEYEEYMNSINY